MKKIIISFLFLLFYASLSAQNKTMIYGNLGVENVNISVIGTQQGTVTNAKGGYTLQITGKNKRINLFYSSIGYRDTVVGITQKMLGIGSSGFSGSTTIRRIWLWLATLWCISTTTTTRSISTILI